MIILKVKGAETAITVANTVANNVLVRVVNPGAAAVLHIAAGGTEYANLTVSNTESVVIEKAPTDTLTGSGMLATPVSYRG